MSVLVADGQVGAAAAPEGVHGHAHAVGDAGRQAEGHQPGSRLQPIGGCSQMQED